MRLPSSLISSKYIVITTICIVLVIAVYSYIFNIDILVTLFNLDLKWLSLSILLALVGFLLECIRLRYMVKLVGGEIGLVDVVKARAIGTLIAYITPSSMGGEPARAYIINLHSSIGFWKAFGVTLIEAYVDAITVCFIALLLSIRYIPLSIFITLTCAYTIVAVNLLLFMALKVKSFSKFIEKFRERYFKSIEDKFNTKLNLTDVIEGIRSLFKRRFSIIIAITFLRHFASIFSIYFVGLAVMDNSSLIRCTEAYFFSSSVGIIPTPGASGALEYGLSITLPPSQVIVIRLINYTLTILLGLLSVILVLKQLKNHSSPH